MYNITEELISLSDAEYKRFHSSLMPGIESGVILGVRVPLLRKLAKRIYREGNYADFINTLPHKYYEENNLHAFIIEQIPDFDTALYEAQRFLGYIDNWATCDMYSPAVFSTHKEELLNCIYKWLESKHTYTVRYGIGMLMRHFLDSDFKEEYLDAVVGVESDEYYVNMMKAWYFATALCKQYDTAIIRIKERSLSGWVHNKTIQKAVESRRIDDETKRYLKTLKY